MGATYFYTGAVDKSPFQDVGAFKQRAMERHPGISDHGISILAKRAVGTLRPRRKRMVVAFWGRDILTDDLEGLWFWQLLKPYQQGRLAAHPLTGGLTIAKDDDVDRKIALISSNEFHNINRSVLVNSHSGRQLSRSYVFCIQTGWQQEISDDDAAILLSYPQIARLLVREDRFHGYNPVQSYSHIPVTNREVGRTMADVEAFKRQFQRSNHVTGVNVPKERT